MCSRIMGGYHFVVSLPNDLAILNDDTAKRSTFTLRNPLTRKVHGHLNEIYICVARHELLFYLLI